MVDRIVAWSHRTMSPFPIFKMFLTFHSTPSSSYLVTVMKSPPKKTAFTPSILVLSLNSKDEKLSRFRTWTKAWPEGSPSLPQWMGRQMCPLPLIQSDQVKTATKNGIVQKGPTEGWHKKYLQRRRIWSFLSLDEEIALWCLQTHLVCKLHLLIPRCCPWFNMIQEW